MMNGLPPPDPEAITLCQIPGMDAVLLLRLIRRWETPAAIGRAPASELRLLGVPPAIVARIVATPRQRAATDAGLRSLQRMGIATVTLLDPAYPARLRDLPGPPLVLYIQGAWPPGTPAVTLIAGTSLQAADREVARALLVSLADLGLAVMANGDEIELLPPAAALAALPFGLLLARGRVPDTLRDGVAAGRSTLVSVAPVNAQDSPTLASQARVLLLALADGVVWAGHPLPETPPDRPDLHQWVLHSGDMPGSLHGREASPPPVRAGAAGVQAIARALGLRVVGTRTAQQERLW